MAQLIGAVDHDIARADAFNQWISENPGATDIGAFLKEFYSNPENMPLEFQKRAAKDVAYIGMDVPTLPDGTYDYRKLIPGKRYVIQDPATEEYSAWIYGGNKNWLPAPISAVTP